MIRRLTIGGIVWAAIRSNAEWNEWRKQESVDPSWGKPIVFPCFATLTNVPSVEFIYLEDVYSMMAVLGSNQ